MQVHLETLTTQPVEIIQPTTGAHDMSRSPSRPANDCSRAESMNPTLREHTMTELEELESIYCEMHKDAYGVKARWYRAESVEQARADLARLEVVVQEQIASDREAERHAIAAFEELARSYGGVETAKRWQHQAYATNGDDEYLCYCMGLPYGYFRAAA